MLKLKASHFKAYLAEQEYTCKSFADKLGCDKSYVSLMQNGKRQPSHRLARKMIKLLECSYEDLFEEEL